MESVYLSHTICVPCSKYMTTSLVLKISSTSDKVFEFNYVFSARLFVSIYHLTWINFRTHSMNFPYNILSEYKRDSESNRAWMRLKICTHRVWTRSTWKTRSDASERFFLTAFKRGFIHSRVQMRSKKFYSQCLDAFNMQSHPNAFE